VLQGPFDEPDFEGLQVGGPGLAEAEVGQDILEVGGPGLGPLPIPAKAPRIDVELAGKMLDSGRGRGAKPGWHEAQVAEGAELHGDAEAVLVPPLLLHEPPVAVGEGEVGDQVLGRDFVGKASESLPLRIGQKAAGHRSSARGQALPGWTSRGRMPPATPLPDPAENYSFWPGSRQAEKPRKN
jgi:hypothetical protein